MSFRFLWLTSICLPVLAAELPADAGTPDTTAPIEPEPVAEPEPLRIRVHYTGATRGVGRSRSARDTLRPLIEQAAAANASFTDLSAVHGVLARGPHLLTVDGTMEATVAFLEGDDIQCSEGPAAQGLHTTTGVLLVDAAALPDWMSDLEEATYPRQVCTSSSGLHATLTTLGDAPLPAWDLLGWEVREAVRGTVTLAGRKTPILAVQDPAYDLSRSVRALTDAVRNDPLAIIVDAGASLDGASSSVDGQPSLHRATALSSMVRLAPSAMVPGDTELVGGARAFIEEQAPIGLSSIATNWDTTDPTLELLPSKSVTVPHPLGPIRVAFVGILDPSLQDVHAGLTAEGITISDPVTAVQPVVDALLASAKPPHAIIALTTASGDVQERIRRELRGVDLLIGDPSMATYRTLSREVRLAQLEAHQKGAALTLPMDGVATAELTFNPDDKRLVNVRTTPIPLTAASPVDPDTTAAITRVRSEVFPALEAPLLGPPDPSASLTGWSSAAWNQLVCEAVRTGSDSDIAIVGPLPAPPSSPGPVSELDALRSLATLDKLEVHRIPGTQIQRLADRLEGSGSVVCGVTPGAYVSLMGPRWLDLDRVYRVVTTTKLAGTAPVGEILDALESSRVLDQPTVKPLASATHPERPATLRSVAIDQLRATRDTVGGPQGVQQELVVDGPARYDPLWLFRVRHVGLQSQSFQGVEDDAFAEVPETLATSPSSYTLGSAADIALEYSGPSLWSDLRGAGMFSRIQAGEEDPEELADDLLLTTSHSLPGLAFPVVAPLKMMPFTEVAYDTEFTPIEVEDGGTGIKQADLSLTLGISALRTGPIRGLRMGGFVNRDMARLDEKPSEFGGRLDWETYSTLGPSVRWTTAANLFVYANTSDDDASDLRLRALGDTRLLLPLATWLDIGVYGQVFALQGRTAVNDRLAASTTWGVTLDMAGAFAL